MVKKVEIQLGGKALTIETGRIAKQAEGSVTVRYGDNLVLVTAQARKEPSENRSFLPLSVDYVEKTFAAVTKGFSTTGVSLVLNAARQLDEVILGFRWEFGMKFVLAKSKHVNPMGAGFYQAGMHMIRVVHPDEYPVLESLSF